MFYADYTKNLWNIVTLFRDQYTSDFERREYEEKPYILLLIAMGSEIEKDGEFKFTSTDIWHFDRECIEDDGDYSIVMERIVELIKGELLITDIEDHIDRENEEVGLSFKLNGETYKFNLTLNDDWLNIGVFKIFSNLLEEHGSDRRFFYSDLGQGILVGAFKKEQWLSLNKLINIFLPV